MYRAITGQPLFEDADIVNLMQKHVSEMPLRFHIIDPALPPELESIVFKALAKDPAERFQSMVQLMESLQYYSSSLSGGYFAASPTTPPNTMAPPSSYATTTSPLSHAESTFPTGKSSGAGVGPTLPANASSQQIGTESITGPIPGTNPIIGGAASSTTASLSNVSVSVTPGAVTNNPNASAEETSSPGTSGTTPPEQHTIQIVLPRKALGIGLGALAVIVTVSVFVMLSPRQTVNKQTPPKQATPAPVQTPAPAPAHAPNPVAPPAATEQPAPPTAVAPAENQPAAATTKPAKHKPKQHGPRAADGTQPAVAPQRQTSSGEPSPSGSSQKKQSIKKKIDKVENAVKKFFRGL
jgi:hypothetical protein